MTRSSLKILLIAIIACPILFYGFDYVNFKMIGFPYAAGSYPFAEGYSFSCDYNDLKTEIEHLRNRDEYHSPANNRLQDRKDENFEHIYFYYKPVNLAFDCIIDSACCNTSSLSLVAVARLNTTENYHERWTIINNDNEVGWLENRTYLKIFEDNIIDQLKVGLCGCNR